MQTSVSKQAQFAIKHWTSPCVVAVLVAIIVPFSAWSLPRAATPTDAALLGRVVDAMGADDGRRGKRTIAIGDVHDPRAVTVLLYVANHENERNVAIAAVAGLENLARNGRVDAVSALESLVAGRRARIAAAGVIALGRIAPSPESFNALMRIASNDKIVQAHRKSAINELKKRFPKRLAGTRLPRLSGPAVLPTLGGAWAGGYLLNVLGRFAKDDSAETIGALTGALIGGGTGYLFGREASIDRQTWFLSSILWGQFTGEFLALSTVTSPNDRVRGAFGVGGEIAGFVGGMMLEDRLDLDAGDTVFVDVSGVAGFLFGAGLTQLLPSPRDQKAGAQLMLATAWLGGVAAVAASERVKLRGPDIYLQVYGAAEGMWYGSFLADTVHDSPAEQRERIFNDSTLTQVERNDRASKIEEDSRDVEVGGLLVGAAVGYGVATAISQNSNLTGGDVTQILVFSQYGKTLGAGLAFLGKFNEDRTNVMQLGIGALGMGIAALTLDDLRFRGGDRALVPLATAWGLFHGGAIASFMAEKKKLKQAQGAGIVFTSGAVLGIAAMAATQELELTNLEATMASTGAFWGAWLGFWTAVRLKTGDGETFMASAIGGDVGAVVTGMLISEYVGLDPLVLAGASFGGLTVAGVGTLLTLMATNDEDALITTNIAGSLVGMAIGGVAANYYVQRRGRRPDKNRRPVMNDDDFSLPTWFAGFNATPIVRENGYEGMTLNLAGRW